jgi:anti-sigma factor RsiW
MDCRCFALQVDDWLDGRLNVAERQSMQSHVENCPGCSRGYADARELRAQMRALAAPALRAEFAERALLKAGAARRGRWALPPMALAASLVLGVGVAAILFALRPEPVHTVILTVQQPESVRLMFNADKPLSGATLSLTLPENVEIVGYGERRELTWQADLGAGGNVLRLPLIAHGPAGGELVARLTLGASSRTFRLKIKIRNAAGAGELPTPVASV